MADADRPLHALTASEASARLAAGTLSAEALARACLDRIASQDAALKAWAFVDPDHAIRAARELDKQPRRSALHGVPVAVKDMIDTADMPTGHNSPLFQGHRPGQDAAIVATLRAAGALILGKTDTTEFAAAGRNAATGNPHDPARTSGGSSAGSAAAVADGHVPLALGTQTGGSTIRPASFCGAYALKPSWSAVSREGAKLYSISLDTVSWYARSVADLDLVADLFGLPGNLAPVASAKGLRIGLCRSPEWASAEPESRAALMEAAARFAAAGAEVTDLDLPRASTASPRPTGASCIRKAGRPSCRSPAVSARSSTTISTTGWRTAPATRPRISSPPTTSPRSARSSSTRWPPASTPC